MKFLLIAVIGFVLTAEIFSAHSQTWQPVGNGFDFAVYSFASDPLSGRLYAGGQFDTADGAPCSRIAQWNGINWDTIGTGLSNGYVSALAMYNNQLYAGGSFTNAGNKIRKFFSRWNGTSWDSIGFTTGNCNVQKLTVYNSGLYIGGQFDTAAGMPSSYISKWNVISWSTVGGGMNGSVYALETHSGKLYGGGVFP